MAANEAAQLRRQALPHGGSSLGLDYAYFLEAEVVQSCPRDGCLVYLEYKGHPYPSSQTISTRTAASPLGY